jgi:hypothetical protein
MGETTGQGSFVFATEPRPVLGPTQPPINGYRAFSSKIKQPEHSADHLPPSNATRNAWSYISTPPYAFPVRSLIKRDNFTFIFCFLYAGTSGYTRTLQIKDHAYFMSSIANFCDVPCLRHKIIFDISFIWNGKQTNMKFKNNSQCNLYNAVFNKIH